MDNIKKIKTFVGLALIGVAAYLFLKKPADIASVPSLSDEDKKPADIASSVPSSISDEDKNSLFITALGYIHPTSSAAAKQKISDLNLTTEFESYLVSLEKTS